MANTKNTSKFADAALVPKKKDYQIFMGNIVSCSSLLNS
jgi:hypothetical protein